MCDRKEQLIGFLYDEVDPAEARAFRQHLLTCAECRTELAELRTTRGQIAAWTPPEPGLDFQIVRAPAATPRGAPPRAWRFSPSWALAAAAILVLAIGAAIANLEVHVGGGQGLVIRTGWNRTPAVTATRVEDASNVQEADWKRLDARLGQIEQVVARNRSSSSSDTSSMSDDDVLQRVRDMLAQSETKQQRILTARLNDITREYDAQRRIDLAAIDQGMARLQNTSGAEVRQYRDWMQRMYRATAYQQVK